MNVITFVSMLRKQYGTENVILSDIKKPPPHVYSSGKQNEIHTIFNLFFPICLNLSCPLNRSLCCLLFSH